MLAAQLITLGRLSLYILTSVGLYFTREVTGEKHLSPQRKQLGWTQGLTPSQRSLPGMLL